MTEPTDTPEPTDAAGDPSRLFALRPEPIAYADPDPTPPARPFTGKPRTRSPKSAKQRSYAIARLYTERHPLIRQAAVAAIVFKAIEDGRFTDDQIKAAVIRLARANWRVTEDNLRTELEGTIGERPVLQRRDHRHPVSDSSVVYIIGSKQARPVKIGTSTNSPQRLASIQMMSPVILEIFHEHPGEYDLEAWLHTKFKRYRIHGEWFDFGELDPVATVSAAIGYYEKRRLAEALEFDPALRRQHQAQLHSKLLEGRA